MLENSVNAVFPGPDFEFPLKCFGKYQRITVSYEMRYATTNAEDCFGACFSDTQANLRDGSELFNDLVTIDSLYAATQINHYKAVVKGECKISTPYARSGLFAYCVAIYFLFFERKLLTLC